MEFINIGSEYIKGWVGGAQVGWVVAKAETKQQDDGMVGFRVIIPQRANIPLQGLERRELTVGVISDPHCQIEAFHWCHFTSHGFT